MKTCTRWIISLITICILVLTGCGSKSTVTPELESTNTPPVTPSFTPITPTITPITPTITPITPQPTLTPFQILQLGNDLPRIPLAPGSSQEIQDNHIGAWFEAHDRFYDTSLVYRYGFKSIRIGSLMGPGQYFGTPINADSLSTDVDNTITEYAENGIDIELILMSNSGVPIHFSEFDTTFQTDEEMKTYLEYVRFVVGHFKGRIRSYEILNEPGFISVDTYIKVIKETIPVIREVDPNARIVIGAIPGSWEDGFPGYGEFQRYSMDINFMNDLLNSGVARDADGISWHPLYDNIPADPYYQDYPKIIQSIKDLATSQGFTGEYFADETLWQTVDEPDWDNGPPVSELVAAKYYTRAIAEHRGLGLNVTINTWFIEPSHLPNSSNPGAPLEVIHNLNDTLAGAEPTSLEFSLDTGVESNIRSYAFTRPDGDVLLALWTNDEAVEDDAGVISTVTIQNFSDQSVIAIDIYNGIKQELLTEEVGNDLIIFDLMIKDYPIILHFGTN